MSLSPVVDKHAKSLSARYASDSEAPALCLPSTPRRNPALSIASLITRTRSSSIDSLPALSSPTSSYSLYPSSPLSLTPPDSPVSLSFLPFSRKPVLQPKADEGLFLLLAAVESVEPVSVSCGSDVGPCDVPSVRTPPVAESDPIVKIEDELETDITFDSSAHDNSKDSALAYSPSHNTGLSRSTVSQSHYGEGSSQILPDASLPEDNDQINTSLPANGHDPLLVLDPSENVLHSQSEADLIHLRSPTTECTPESETRMSAGAVEIEVVVEDPKPRDAESTSAPYPPPVSNQIEEPNDPSPCSLSPHQADHSRSDSLPDPPLLRSNAIRGNSIPSLPTPNLVEVPTTSVSDRARKRKRRTSDPEIIDITSDHASVLSPSVTDDDDAVNGPRSTVRRPRKGGRKRNNVLPLASLTADSNTEGTPSYEGDPCEGVDMCALLIDALVFGRVAFQSASELVRCVLRDQPHLLERQDGLKWLEMARKVLVENACFGRIARRGKDADGNKLEDTWYYEPSMDPDHARAETLSEVAPSTKRRKAKMGDRTYFYAPIDMNRWVVAAELGDDA
ncbi:uncharacterized protein EI90DRAFT_3016543 [Cantharellus anzutake]|uniref:uncharacterized protein n=1 Tax=Cantharellus anzutake TaxID=1750568 RepID=UPI0019082583|nr:uncharacterized protein EI90DRAFT_3016543 [Cantharellus anzutake]KAF8331104.1 hypothetical protein EI90DRAFT_3016543 [Cantharellus anzutake]